MNCWLWPEEYTPPSVFRCCRSRDSTLMFARVAIFTPPKRPAISDWSTIPAPRSSMTQDDRSKILPRQPAARRHTPADKPPSEPPMTNARGLLLLALIFALRSRQSRRPALRHQGCRLRFSRQGKLEGLPEKF